MGASDSYSADGELAQAISRSRLIGVALIFGVVMFTVFASVIGNAGSPAPAGPPNQVPPTPTGFMGLDTQNEMLFFIGAGMALFLVPGSFVLRSIITRTGTNTTGSAIAPALSGFVLGCAMCEGPGLFGAVIVLLSGQVVPPGFIVVLSVMGLVIHLAMPLVKGERDPNQTAYNIAQ